MMRGNSNTSRNKTLTLDAEERERYAQRLLRDLSQPVSLDDVVNSTICGDTFALLELLPGETFDLIFADPPYNMTKSFHGYTFREQDMDSYESWLQSWIPALERLLKPDGSIYICGDWRSSSAIHRVMAEHFVIRNRISWEREKGRGAKANWKNNTEDIWFATKSSTYTFNIEDVKLRRKVIAPYRDHAGKPKDWEEQNDGNYRITHPSNIWTDITVPFWSMPENTEHPTQKPEKLLAKVILASSNPGDVVFDPFLGSGTTSVVARKLGRRFVGIEQNEEYCCLTEKRLERAESDHSIQGYSSGVFWERNSAEYKQERNADTTKNVNQ